MFSAHSESHTLHLNWGSYAVKTRVVRIRFFGRIRARIRIYSGICCRIFVHDCPLKKERPPTGSSGRHYVKIPSCGRKLMSNIVVLLAITVAQDIGYLS